MFFISLRYKKINDKFFNDSDKVDVDILLIISTVKVIPEAYLQPIRTSKIMRFFVIFSKKYHRRCSKYTSAYTYKQVRPIEIICIMNIFSVKYLFLTKEEWHKAAISELKFLSLHFILVNRIHFVWFISSDALRVKPNPKYMTHFLAVLKMFKGKQKQS